MVSLFALAQASLKDGSLSQQLAPEPSLNLLMQSVYGQPVWTSSSGEATPCTPASSCSQLPFHDSLSAIVTGLENSGTTVLSELLMSAPKHFGGFECGLLLACTPKDFEHVSPFYNWLPKNWKLDGTEVLSGMTKATCHQQAYAQLKASPCLARAGATSLVGVRRTLPTPMVAPRAASPCV